MGRGSVEMESALHRKRSKCKPEVEDCLVNPKEAEARVAEPECSQGHRTAFLACSEGCPKGGSFFSFPVKTQSPHWLR